jgi:hypothetical protein
MAWQGRSPSAIFDRFHLPREFPVDEPIRRLYIDTWDVLEAEAEQTAVSKRQVLGR